MKKDKWDRIALVVSILLTLGIFVGATVGAIKLHERYVFDNIWILVLVIIGLMGGAALIIAGIGEIIYRIRWRKAKQ